MNDLKKNLYAAQKIYHDLPKRISEISNANGLDQQDAIIRFINDVTTDLKTMANETASASNALNSKINNLSQQYATVKAQSSAKLKDVQEKLQAKREKLKDLNNEYLKYMTLLDTCKANSAQLESFVKNITDMFDGITQDGNLKEAIQKVITHARNCDTYSTLKHSIEDDRSKLQLLSQNTNEDLGIKIFDDLLQEEEPTDTKRKLQPDELESEESMVKKIYTAHYDDFIGPVTPANYSPSTIAGVVLDEDENMEPEN